MDVQILTSKILEFTSTDELTAALSALAKLEAEAQALDGALARAADKDAGDLASLWCRDLAIGFEVWAQRMKVQSLQIAAKEKERDDLQSALDRLEGHQIEEAADIWQGVRDAEREAAEEHRLLVARAREIEDARSDAQRYSEAEKHPQEIDFSLTDTFTWGRVVRWHVRELCPPRMQGADAMCE